MAMPLPMNRPVPMAPPRPIMVIWPLDSSLCRPLSRRAMAAASSAGTAGGAAESDGVIARPSHRTAAAATRAQFPGAGKPPPHRESGEGAAELVYLLIL